MPGLIDGDGFRANLRRVVQSPTFTETFGDDIWNAPYYTPADEIGRLIPLGKRKSSGKAQHGARGAERRQTRMHREVLHSGTPKCSFSCIP